MRVSRDYSAFVPKIQGPIDHASKSTGRHSNTSGSLDANPAGSAVTGYLRRRTKNGRGIIDRTYFAGISFS